MEVLGDIRLWVNKWLSVRKFKSTGYEVPSGLKTDKASLPWLSSR